MLENTSLFIKHLPPEFSREEREELLKLVGATKVRVMPDEGKMKYSAFATFPNHEDAKFALSLLHQKKVLDKRLVVEFAKQNHAAHIPHQSDYPEFKDVSTKESAPKLSDKEVLRHEMEDFSRKLHGVAPALGLDYLPSPLVKYKYPPPTPTIIHNISHALASVPKFYTQVLHLMNKMNLPAPFGPLTPAPPLAADVPESLVQQSDQLIQDMDTSSEEESEYESEPEDGRPKPTEKILPHKSAVQKPKRKKRKLMSLVPPPILTVPRQRTEPSEVFESTTLCQKKITMKNIELINPAEPVTSFETAGGFGAIDPTKTDDENPEKKEEATDEEWDDCRFVSLSELRDKRISSKEMKTLSIFRNSSSGEPTCRLYIKNLAKQVEEKDLRYLFGRFINRNSELERNMFDVRLMKEGRMKGQAFVTLANEKQAIEAVRETNGYILYTKPLVVQFARSAKPKEEDKKGKKT